VVHTINPACSKLTFRPLHHLSHHRFTIFHHHKAHHYPLLRKALGDALRTLEQQRPKMPGPAIPTCLAERSYDAQAQQLAQLQQGIQAGDVPSGSLPGILPDIYIYIKCIFTFDLSHLEFSWHSTDMSDMFPGMPCDILAFYLKLYLTFFHVLFYIFKYIYMTCYLT